VTGETAAEEAENAVTAEIAADTIAADLREIAAADIIAAGLKETGADPRETAAGITADLKGIGVLGLRLLRMTGLHRKEAGTNDISEKSKVS